MAVRLPLSTRTFRRISQEPYVCPSCLLKANQGPVSIRISQKRRYRNAPSGSHELLDNRPRPPTGVNTPNLHVSFLRSVSNGSLASRTAINAPTTVPQAHRDLFQKLLALEATASSYVDQSRLQLVIRSLESSNPTIRVALSGLGRNGALAAGKLARVLLSDALSQEEPFEEDVLDTIRSGRNVLLRYGDAMEETQSNALVRTISIPSRYLERYNLELLITTFDVDGNSSSSDDRAALEDALLAPPLTTPNSNDGRIGFVRYPVHKAVIVAEGVTGAVEYGRLPATLADDALISSVLNVHLTPSAQTETPDQRASGNQVDLELASHAIKLFRDNRANGAQFNDEWQRSKISDLSEWITGAKNQPSTSELNPAVYSLVDSLLSRASTSISVSEDAETALATANTVPDTKRAILQRAISEWSADAHRDLQINLDTVFQDSPSWRRTAWWRLFWRIDDVTLSAASIIRNSWLTEAEQRLAFLSGRIFDSGLATGTQLTGPDPGTLEPARQEAIETAETIKRESGTVAELSPVPSVLSRMQQQSGNNTLFSPPWPQNIHLSRQYILRSLVPDLHRKAQGLLVTALSTIGGSAALSAWFFVATAGLGVYESGAIVALGLVWSLRRLQKHWSKEREEFADAVREDARRVLGEVEGHLRRLVNDGGKANVRIEDVRHWQEARGAVGHCREALEKLHSGP